LLGWPIVKRKGKKFRERKKERTSHVTADDGVMGTETLILSSGDGGWFHHPRCSMLTLVYIVDIERRMYEYPPTFGYRPTAFICSVLLTLTWPDLLPPATRYPHEFDLPPQTRFQVRVPLRDHAAGHTSPSTPHGRREGEDPAVSPSSLISCSSFSCTPGFIMTAHCDHFF